MESTNEVVLATERARVIKIGNQNRYLPGHNKTFTLTPYLSMLRLK